MTCRHTKYDPSCSSHATRIASLKSEYAEQVLKKSVDTPDSKNFEIEDVLEVSEHLVLKVKYPNCAACAYEGNKVMVFFCKSVKDAIRWKTIDPHFRLPNKLLDKSEAPPPNARFPGSTVGWEDAVAFATSKVGKKAVMR